MEYKELFGALAKAQAEMETADLNSDNPFFKSKYADLSEIVKASRPALVKNGLSVIQQIKCDDLGNNFLHTLLCHSSGEYIESRMKIIPVKNDVQSMGSCISYLRRYMYAALVGVVTSDEDDDGEKAMVQPRQIYRPVEPKSEIQRISRDQLEELEHELMDEPELEEEIVEKLKIKELSDMPLSRYRAAITRIRELKQLKNQGK